MHEDPVEPSTRMDRYRVPRPRLQRVAGWCALASIAAIACLVWLLTTTPESSQNVRALLRSVPFVLIPLGALGVLVVTATVSMIYWLRVESASSSLPSGRNGVAKATGRYRARNEWRS